MYPLGQVEKQGRFFIRDAFCANCQVGMRWMQQRSYVPTISTEKITGAREQFVLRHLLEGLAIASGPARCLPHVWIFPQLNRATESCVSKIAGIHEYVLVGISNLSLMHQQTSSPG